MNKHIVFFDAECPLCRTVKAVLKRLDWNNTIFWHPVQEVRESIKERVNNNYKNMYDEIYMYTIDKRVLTGFNTVRKILSLLPATIPLALLLYLPFVKNIGDPVYRFISTHRYKWFGRVPYNRMNDNQS
ncbi:hypothetical protein Pryu01_02443 [Paraliobacillus ryukyuensis]|uniref:Putative DCC family thiol-disulfide oxidoreductase YuxK n=1 Tax=Paraliobacillus ryukyuensis TaxID=200904 RepID=A0A366DU01_9BACI|nr:DUF393 domain-containing protein [Paraliobacillus ryukyuensis]RBO93570.1 putative DCC family thiol-disulfide oxidoreductase YuxK [Paraliobacillus ryukyuensis]